MGEGSKKPKKAKFSEEDAATLLQRYSATTVLSLLQEVAQVQDVKMDWKELVKKTKTGITSAREYQMLWRNLAYRHALVDRLDSEAESAECLDDDSDLESEVTAMPSVSSDTSTEAAACVKVLITSGSQSETSLANGSTVEAPLFINIPCRQSAGAPTGSKLQRKNITVPVTVQKVTKSSSSTNACAERLDGKRKRKPWSEEEDLDLIAAVQIYGEGNWANIIKGSLMGGRTPSQLSQRWQIIRKKQQPMNNGSTPQVSEAMAATRRAVNLAIDMPDSLTVARPNGVPYQTFMVGQKHPTTTDGMLKAVALSSGGRVATPSDAASFHKATQEKKAYHIMSGPLPPNVHILRSSHPAKSSSTNLSSVLGSTSRSTQQVQNNNPSKPVGAAPQSHQSAESTTAGETKVKACDTNPPKEKVKDDQVADAASAPSKNAVEGECGGTDTVPEVEMAAPVSDSAQNEGIQEEAATGETTDPAQEGQVASSESALKPQNDGSQELKLESSSQEAAVGDGESGGDVVMTEAQVKVEEEPK